MPWLQWLQLVAVLADPELLTDKWSGCGEVTTDDVAPLFFSPCATSEWEVLLTDTVANHQKQRNATALLRLPESENRQGCSPHPNLHFQNSIALIQRGSCYFSWKVVLAEEAGALAVIIYDTVERQSTAVLAIAGPFPNPRIPGYLISREKGQDLAGRLEIGDEIDVLCSWNPIEVWFGLPNTSTEFNDTLTMENYGDEEMRWVLDVIDHNKTFEEDPFYTAQVLGSIPSAFQSTFVESFDLASFNGSVELDDEAELLPLPFVFPHYLRFYEKTWVSCNGALIFDPVLDQLTKQAAVLGSGIGPHAVLAAMWGDLLCPEGSKISARHGEGLIAVRFEGLRQKSNPNLGNLTFEVRLHRDGRILLLLEDFPANSTALSQFQVGLQPATGARALSVGTDLPWSSGPPLAVSFTPWLMVENKKVAVPPNETLTVDLVFERQHDLYGWLFFYAERSIGSWHPRRNVRFTQRVFRYFWSLSAWDGGMHSGVCGTGFVRRRNRTCFGSDAQVYDDSFCIGSCMDKDPVLYWDYPNTRIWKDGYENRCEDYRVLDLCREDGYGSKWQPWWGSFNDWVTSGLGADTACCLCGGGTYTPALPHIEEACPSVSCPANSVGSNVLEGCSCLPLYVGEINRSEDYPYFTGACWPVPCPEHSSGYAHTGCTCDYGYVGNITVNDTEPFFSGSCQETTTGTTSTATSTKSTTTTVTTSSRTSSITSTTSTTKSSSSSTATISTTTTLTTSSKTSSITSTTSTTQSSSSSTTTISTTTTLTTSSKTSSITTTTSTTQSSSSSTMTTSTETTQTSSSTSVSSSTATTLTSTSSTVSITTETQTLTSTNTSSSTRSTSWTTVSSTTTSLSSTKSTRTVSSTSTVSTQSILSTTVSQETTAMSTETSTARGTSQTSGTDLTNSELENSTDLPENTSNATEATGVLGQAQFAGIDDLETSSASFLFFVFLLFILWVAAMCGGICYFLSKRFRRTQKSPSKVTPTEEVEKAEKVLRGWSEGDLTVRKEGEDLLKKLKTLWSHGQGGFRSILPDPECHPSSFENSTRDLFQRWRQERDSKDMSSSQRKLLRMSDIAEKIALRSEGNDFTSLRNAIEEEWLKNIGSQSKEMQDPTDSAATTLMRCSMSSSICSVDVGMASVFVEEILEVYKNNAELWTTLQKPDSKVGEAIRQWSNSSKVLEDLSEDAKKQLLEEVQEVLQQRNRTASDLAQDLTRIWERAEFNDLHDNNRIQEAIPEHELSFLGKESLRSSQGVVSCGEDLLQQLHERWRDMHITTSNVHADLQTFCSAWREEKLLERPDVDDAVLRRLVGELTEVVYKEVGAGKDKQKAIDLFPEIQEAWHRLAVAEDAEDAVWEGAQPKAHLQLEEHAGLHEFVENDEVAFKPVPASLPELEELPDEDMLAPVKTMPSSQPELEDVDEDELVPLKTVSGQEDQNMCEEEARVLVEAESEGMVEDHQITSPKPEVAGSSNLGNSALLVVGQTRNESEAPVDEHLRHLLLVEELEVVFSSHRWNGESEEQLVRLKEGWHEKRNMTTAEATHCAVEARMRARNRPELLPESASEWTQHAELLVSGEDFLRKLLQADNVQQVAELCQRWCESSESRDLHYAMATEAQHMLLAKELMSLESTDVATAIRMLWKDVVEEAEAAAEAELIESDLPDVLASSMQEWNDLSKVLEDDENDASLDRLERSIQEGSEELFLEDAEGQSSEWLQASQVSQVSQISFQVGDESRKLQAAAAAYGSLVDNVLEVCDNRPDMSFHVANVVTGWQQKQVENPEVAGTQDLLSDMAETTRNLIKSQGEKKFSKSFLKCLFEQAWEKKMQEPPKDRTPWTNCEILYRRGEALLNQFAEIVKASRRQKMKGSHVKRQLAQTADHWCHRTLAAAVGADVVSYKLLRDMALEAQRIFVAKAKETAKSDGFTAATFLRTALPQTREAWRALLVDVQGNVADDSWKQWLDSWETPSEVKSRENVEKWKAGVNKIKGIGALLGKERRPSQVLQAFNQLNGNLGNSQALNPEKSESLRPSGSLKPSEAESSKPIKSPSTSFQAFISESEKAGDASQSAAGTASGALIRQRRPSGASSSGLENWSPDYAGSGGRRESSIKQDRRDSQSLGEFRDIYARRESQMSEGSSGLGGGVGGGLGSLPLSSASVSYLAVPKRKSQRSGSVGSQGSDFSFTSSASSKRMGDEFERILSKSSPSRKESASPFSSPFPSQQANPRRSAGDQDRSADESTSRRGSRRRSTLTRAGSTLTKDVK